MTTINKVTTSTQAGPTGIAWASSGGWVNPTSAGCWARVHIGGTGIPDPCGGYSEDEETWPQDNAQPSIVQVGQWCVVDPGSGQVEFFVGFQVPVGVHLSVHWYVITA